METIFDKEELVSSLCNIKDPRHKKGQRYKLEDLLLLTIYAILAGHSESTEIEYYTELHFDYFKDLIGLTSVPSHDTFSRIKRLVDFEELSGRLSEWLYSRFSEICRKYETYRVLHVDGKAIRAASAKSEGENPIYILNSMYEGGTVNLYTKRIEDKGNEISALPEYLQFFNLQDTIVTIDAIGCSTNVIDAIHSKGGKFLLPVKDNNPRLRSTLQTRIQQLKESGEYEELSTAERMTKDHGRTEKITATLLTDTSFIYNELGTEKFYGHIARVCVIDKHTVTRENGKDVESDSTCLLITDAAELTVDEILEIKLSHWHIESQHWLLDVIMDEDFQTERKGNALSNSAVLRRFCLQLRKYDPEMEKKPLSRFLMRNEAYIDKIEELLFGKVLS